MAARMGPKEVLTAKDEAGEVLATRVNLRGVLAAKRRCKGSSNEHREVRMKHKEEFE